ncbi:laccase, multicopper oxidase, benzenediol:oxygen oxidorectuctase [Diatrype stigma]|uniref:laccase n=1 Tax=Diatrype stigma TaxID=117547 RepID=A0AAN9YUI2_9PEZI
MVHSFTWEITEEENWLGPDGVIKDKVMLIDGQLPGPTLEADWGDTVSVTIINKLKFNGTSIHWHGLRMVGNNINDGVNGVTECPIPPGTQKTYTWKARQYGTTWYHSHFSAQYGNGVYGPIVINGPASLPYDIDLGPYPISDYYYPTAEELTQVVMATPGAPDSDNVLFNGKNINPLGEGGEYSKLTFTPGKRHRLRLINPSVEHNYQVSIVDHDLTVIATDLVPVNALTTNNVFLGTGQRVDVIIDASEDVGNYWLNVTMFEENQCGRSKNPFPAAIVHYDGAPDALPTDEGTRPANSLCADTLDYKPVLARAAPLDSFLPVDNNTFDISFEVAPVVTWKVDGSAINVDWNRPVLQYVLEGNTSYPASNNLVHVDAADAWTFWVVENGSPVDHPMHLHGHDMLVLGKSARNAGSFTGAALAENRARLRGQNPTRRDTTMLPAGGWMVMAFVTDNPGVWLFHCHIAWHVSGGLSVDFLERAADQPDLVSAAQADEFAQTCEAWNEFWEDSTLEKPDSGLRKPSPPSGVKARQLF